MSFYTFDQNNSGGSFINDNNVTNYVIIEADDYRFANIIAEDKGIYFNGCEEDIDCPCCGDRWYPAYGKGDTDPLVYGENPGLYDCMWVKKGEVYCRVYYKDGTIKEFVK